MKCSSCQNKKELKKLNINYKYKDCGLDNVVLLGVSVARCDVCGEEYYNFGDIEKLHNKIAEILLTKSELLTGKEIRFLRKNIGYSGAMFAHLIAYSHESLSRIENGAQKVTESFDRLVRFAVSDKLPKSRNYDLHNLILNNSGHKLLRIELVRTPSGDWKEKLAA
jgi:putative zinc finger/helix-turn-helix YgiT family protein